MERVLVGELSGHVGEQVQVAGWLHQVRALGGVTFVLLRDRSGIVQAFLAQSPQRYKQIMVGVFERVFEIAPVFRAEPHATTRHLNEYVSVDVEIGFIADHRAVMAFLQGSLADAFATLAETRAADLALLDADVPTIGEIPSIRFRDALELIAERYGEDARGEPDLAPRHERWLSQWAREEYGSDFLFVTGYPTVKRPFYTMPDPADPAYTHSFDLLFRGLEVVTGGQRIHRAEQLVASMARFGIPPVPFAGYLEAFRYGMPRTAASPSASNASSAS